MSSGRISGTDGREDALVPQSSDALVPTDANAETYDLTAADSENDMEKVLSGISPRCNSQRLVGCILDRVPLVVSGVVCSVQGVGCRV